ncbi:MAG: hypothetical protein FWD51_03110 [Betaproteobacteria bacterium]|nr:hypothetical protein [Betaproteobacteria bacterium]
MYRGGDSVFRLSLVGIAFILICFLLIVFSRMYTDVEVARTEALTRLDKRQQENTQPLAQQAFESARQELEAQLLEAGANPDKVIGDLLDKTKIETELATEKKRVQELGAQLAGLGELKKILTQASKTPVLDGTSTESLFSALELRARLGQELLSTSGSETRLTDNEIAYRALAAVNFKRNIEALVEAELGLSLVPGQESAWEQWLIADSQQFKTALSKSDPGTASARSRAGNEDTSMLRAQVNFLRARLETHGDRFVPPCWFDNTGKIQYLFTIELRPGRPESVVVESAWPPARETSAQAIPGIKPLLTRKQMPYTTFKERANSIAQHAGKQCRYSVQVIDNLRSGMRSERVHQELEPFFHLVDMPR